MYCVENEARRADCECWTVAIGIEREKIESESLGGSGDDELCRAADVPERAATGVLPPDVVSTDTIPEVPHAVLADTTELAGGDLKCSERDRRPSNPAGAAITAGLAPPCIITPPPPAEPEPEPEPAPEPDPPAPK